ncbi:hypothetical protein ED733_000918 [Metarhizium rileyi]|uniref:WSC domain-containing protein n=1 Tax=Metarhizium rileyi (strain RCEF 4871) TaxID=1649241 RepID=A0A5C6G0F2_METRR|nr:hypothetical protein ED733_000918 [Metarhizium rileyi]
MSLDLCASSCASPLFGVFHTDCFCGHTLGTSDGKSVESSCNIACPGNKHQSCGGKVKLARRDNVPAGVLLSVYEREVDRPTTAHKVVTNTRVITITSCPPVVTNCPIGKKSTKTMTATVPYDRGLEEWQSKKVTCYGDYCVSESHCDKCEQTRVVFNGIKYVCEASPDSNSNWHRLVQCKDNKCRFSKCQGNACNQKIVCFDGQCTPEACYGDECRKKLVCNNGECSHKTCSGDDCHKMWVCNDGKCIAQPACTGDCAAPAPAPVKPAPHVSTPASHGTPISAQPGTHDHSEKSWDTPGSHGGDEHVKIPGHATGGATPNANVGIPSEEGGSGRRPVHAEPGSEGTPAKTNYNPDVAHDVMVPGNPGEPGTSRVPTHKEDVTKPGNRVPTHKEDVAKPSTGRIPTHEEDVSKPSNKASKPVNASQNEQQTGSDNKKGGSDNKGEPSNPDNKGVLPTQGNPAGKPKKTSPIIVAGSNKGVVSFTMLAAAVGLALIM